MYISHLIVFIFSMNCHRNWIEFIVNMVSTMVTSMITMVTLLLPMVTMVTLLLHGINEHGNYGYITVTHGNEHGNYGYITVTHGKSNREQLGE